MWIEYAEMKNTCAFPVFLLISLVFSLQVAGHLKKFLLTIVCHMQIFSGLKNDAALFPVTLCYFSMFFTIPDYLFVSFLYYQE